MQQIRYMDKGIYIQSGMIYKLYDILLNVLFTVIVLRCGS